MDNRVLKEFKETISTNDLDEIMKPEGEINDVIKCSYKDLIELRLTEVPNLFKADKKNLKFRHDSNLIISKYEGKIREEMVFEMVFEERPFFECGINYLGRLRLANSALYIRIPGEGTYDPASRLQYLNKQNYAIITGFYCAALYALKRGSQDIFKKIFKIFKLNKANIQHKYLVSYMKYQIEATIISRAETMDYGLWLKQDTRYLKESLLKKEHEDLVMYVYLISFNLKTEIFPSNKYITELLKNRETAGSTDLIKFILANKKRLFLLPEINFVKKFARVELERKVFDMRELNLKIEKLESNYSGRLKEVMGNRGSEMKDLVRPYYNCFVF